MNQSRGPSVERAVGRAVLLFRLLAVAWMAVMVGISLVTDSDSNAVVVIGALVVAIGGAAWSTRHLAAVQPMAPRIVAVDAALAIVVALSPQLAGASDAFYGGYPMSAVVVVSATLGVGWGLGAAGVFVVTQTLAWVMGAASAPTASELVSLAVMATVVALVVSLGSEFLRAAEERRVRAETRLGEERQKHEVARARLAERISLADDLHDSLLQTVRVISSSADDPDRVRTLARRQEKELVGLIERMHGGPDSGAAAALRAEAADVEELFGVPFEVVASGDVVVSDAVGEMIRAAREVMVNAARHSGASRVDVTLEVGTGTVTVVVRDRGVGFDASAGASGHGLESVRSRMARVGGELSVLTAPGDGTEVELTVSRERS